MFANNNKSNFSATKAIPVAVIEEESNESEEDEEFCYVPLELLEFVDLNGELDDDSGLPGGCDDISVDEILNNAIVTVTNEEGIETVVNKRLSTLEVENIPCASHTLNLVATSDFQKVLKSSAPINFQDPYNSAHGKLKKLWNLHNRSPKAAEVFFRELG